MSDSKARPRLRERQSRGAAASPRGPSGGGPDRARRRRSSRHKPGESSRGPQRGDGAGKSERTIGKSKGGRDRPRKRPVPRGAFPFASGRKSPAQTRRRQTQRRRGVETSTWVVRVQRSLESGALRGGCVGLHPRPLDFRNVPRWSSSSACRSCSCVFITIGTYHAASSSSGFPENRRNRIPSSPACPGKHWCPFPASSL